jgi:predicted nucleic acid-binding protein
LSVAFDTEALLIFFLDEPGADKVKELLEKTESGEVLGYLNVVNLTEFTYILQRRHNWELAQEKERSLRVFGLRIVPVVDDELWRVAANIRAEHQLSLADSFAAATAKVKKAKLVTGRGREYEEIDVRLIRLRN